MDAARYGLNRLLDGKLPKDGWRSTWTVWYQKDPMIEFDLGEERELELYGFTFRRGQEMMN